MKIYHGGFVIFRSLRTIGAGASTNERETDRSLVRYLHDFGECSERAMQIRIISSS